MRHELSQQNMSAKRKGVVIMESKSNAWKRRRMSFRRQIAVRLGVGNWASLVAQLVKNSPCNGGDLGLIPGLGRSPGEGKGYPLQYSGLEDSMDCIVHGVAKSRTGLSDVHFHFLMCIHICRIFHN